jgi:pSer/pThr/pTyr-binding forkhead associated (FHA) protein
VLGADGSCDIVLTDATVSRKHAEIQVTADGEGILVVFTGRATKLDERHRLPKLGSFF